MLDQDDYSLDDTCADTQYASGRIFPRSKISNEEEATSGAES